LRISPLKKFMNKAEAVSYKRNNNDLFPKVTP